MFRQLKLHANTVGNHVIADDEALPFKAESFDGVLSCLNSHWINNLDRINFSQCLPCSSLFAGYGHTISTILKPKSPFIGAMLGEHSLMELK